MGLVGITISWRKKKWSDQCHCYLEPLILNHFSRGKLIILLISFFYPHVCPQVLFVYESIFFVCCGVQVLRPSFFRYLSIDTCVLARVDLKPSVVRRMWSDKSNIKCTKMDCVLVFWIIVHWHFFFHYLPIIRHLQ